MPAGASVAVVIVDAGAGVHLPRAVEAAQAQQPAPRRVIVVDNGGDAPDLPGAETLRPGRNLGFAAANNRAVELADDCDWVALLNPDAFPEPGWLAALMEAAERHPQAVAFGSRLVRDDDPARLDAVAVALHVSGMAWLEGHGHEAAWGADAREVLAPSAAAAMYRRDVFLDAGGFDESFFCYFEDVDLALRLALAGQRARYVPGAVVRHVGSATTSPESEFAVYHSQRNLVWTWAKGMPAPLVWLYLPAHLAVLAALTVWFIVRGRGRAVLRARRDALRGLPAALRARRRIQAQRRVSGRELRRLLARGLPRPGR